MTYQVTARKWRPQKYDEIVFQYHVSTTLKNSVKAGRISHAYIFSGPRGVGKTTTARILAKSLNCVHGPTPDPCGVCDNCVEIKNGSSFDVIEIDGASNRGIEDIRELRENVNFAPVKSKYKVYIIDEVHMLTEPAFNALLKTLEEPPAHIVFIFATTEIHQVPETILSRCQKFFFKKIPMDAVVAHLSKIAHDERRGISDEALFALARAAEGSMRDAQSLLDQVMSFSGEGRDVSEEDALAILGIVPVESYLRLLGYIDCDDVPNIINEISRVTDIGVDLPRYSAGFADIIRTVRLVKNGIAVSEMLGYSSMEAEALKGMSRNFTDEDLSRMYQIAFALQRDLRFAVNERINVEMAFLDMASVKKLPSISSIVKRLEGGSIPSPAEGKQAKKGTVPGPAVRAGSKAPALEAMAPGCVPSDKNIDSKEIQKIWVDFLREIQNGKNYLYTVLQATSIELDGDILYILFRQDRDDHDGSFYSKILNKEKIDIIEEGVSSRAGKRIAVRIRIDGPKDSAAMADSGNMDALSDAPLPEEEMIKNPELEELARVNPTIEKIKDVFHGQIIEKGDK